MKIGREVRKDIKPIGHLYFMMFVLRDNCRSDDSGEVRLQWEALHVHRLARKHWSSDGERGFLGVRTRKGMGNPLRETMILPRALLVGIALLQPRIFGPEWYWEHLGMNTLGLPVAICLSWEVRLSFGTASSPSWFSTGSWGDLEREGKSNCLN